MREIGNPGRTNSNFTMLLLFGYSIESFRSLCSDNPSFGHTSGISFMRQHSRRFQLAVFLYASHIESSSNLCEQHTVDGCLPTEMFIAMLKNRELSTVGLHNNNRCRIGLYCPPHNCTGEQTKHK